MKEINLTATGGNNPGVSQISFPSEGIRIDNIFRSQAGKSIYCAALSPDQSKYAF